MTGLLLALKAFFEEKLAQWRNTDPTGDLSAVHVFIGAAPQRSGSDAEQYPLVLVRPREGEDQDGKQNRAEAVVEIICGVHVETSTGTPEEGTVGLSLMVDRVRRELMKAGRIGGRYSLQKPLEWRVGGEDGNQAHPQYLASLTTRWNMPGIDRILSPEKEAEIYGNGIAGLPEVHG